MVITATRCQVATVVVVDNGSTDQPLQWLRRRQATGEIELVECGENLGIAAAHNAGIRRAQDRGAQYVLLLDQDSVPDARMVETLVNAHSTLERKGVAVSAVGPRYVDPRAGHSSFFVRFGTFRFLRSYCHADRCNEVVAADFLISSGSLISCRTLAAVGNMEEGLFVDHVDTEWFLRARANGFGAFGVCDAVMTHTLGSRSLRVWLGRWRHVPEHSPLRHYYIFRNSILLYRRPYAARNWVRNDILRLLFMLIYYPLRTAPRLEHLRMMLRGAWDGWRGSSGKLETVRRRSSPA